MKANRTFRTFLNKYKHAWVFLYALIYMPWFMYLEEHVTSNYYVIHSTLDDYIPFVEYFIVPYMLWFAFIAAVFAYFFFTDKKGFYKLSIFLFTGMTAFLLISTVFPNGLALRPAEFVRDNVFVDLVKALYKTDTPTNVLPSIHVFNSVGAYIAISHSEKLRKKGWVRYGSLVLSILIIMATVFLKQHSVVDVGAAFIMAGILYVIVYVPEARKSPIFSRQPV